MNEKLESLLLESWIRVLVIYRLWGSASRFKYCSDSESVRSSLHTWNTGWKNFKYKNVDEAWERFFILYHTFDSVPTSRLINACSTLEVFNDEVMQKQACIFKVEQEVLEDVFRIILRYAAADNTDNVEETISLNVLKYHKNLPFIIKNPKKKNIKQVSIF